MSNQTPSDKDPASRLAEMLAQSLDELTRPASDKPVRIAEPPASAANAAVIDIVPKGQLPKAGPAPELEAWFEQFQKKVQAEPPVVFPKPAEPLAPPAAAPAEAVRPEPTPEPVRAAEPKFELDGHVMAALPETPPPPPADNDDHDAVAPLLAPAAPVMPAAAAPAGASPAEAPLDPEAARVVRKVRRLMLVSMLITLIGVGSVFGIIGYRVYKNDGAGGKLFGAAAPAAAPAPAAAAPLEKTLRLPANARVLAAGVAEGRLAVTIALDGRIEVRTFDLQTLEPAARMGFSATP